MDKRKMIYLSLLCSYLIPLSMTFHFHVTKKLFFLIVVLFGVLGWLVLRFWEKKMQQSVSQIVNAKIDKMRTGVSAGSKEASFGHESTIQVLQEELAKKNEQQLKMGLEIDEKMEQMRLAYLEFEDLRKEHRRLEEDSELYHKEAQAQLKHKESLIFEYQKTISEQRIIIENKQKTIQKLESRVGALMNELRSLLHQTLPVSENEGSLGGMMDAFLTSSEQIHTPFDCTQLLKKYIEKTESLSGALHLDNKEGKHPRFLDLSFECNAVDRRRLFDSFKDESSVIIFIYSPPDKKFLFANHAVKTLTGWSCEKFMKEFPRLVVGGYPDWEEAISKLSRPHECSLKLFIQKKGAKPRGFNCYMGCISKGPFARTVLGMLC